MNVFDFINQYKKSNVSTYGDLLENKFNPENDLSGAEKAMYNQLKAGDINRIKLNENRNLISGTPSQPHPTKVSGIGKVIQIC